MNTVVVLDDESGLTDVVAAALTKAGFCVHTGSDGAEGLRLISKIVPDIVLLDCMMPVLNGPGVFRAMRADGRLARIPVLVMSSLPESEAVADIGGYEAFLRKPFPLDALLAAVDRAMATASLDGLRGSHVRLVGRRDG
jgi:DNA-binding response OmpR family regulator